MYLSSRLKTALLEVRPWIAQEVMVGEFKILNNLKCINVSNDKRDYSFYIETPPDVCEQQVWADINASFSRPISPGDEQLLYIPTQYLAELLKNEGYDGIIYKSSLDNDGYNIVLFDQSNVKLIDSKIVKITSLTQEHDEII